MLRQFQFASILGIVGRFEAAQVVLQLFSGSQALAQAIPVAELDVIVVVCQGEFATEALLGLLRQGIGELVRLEVGRADLSDHPVVQFLVGKFAVQEGIGIGGLRNGDVLRCQFFAGDVRVDLRREYLRTRCTRFRRWPG